MTIKNAPCLRQGAFLLSDGTQLAAGQYIGADAPGRIDGLGNRVIVVAGDNDRVAVRINAADHTNMTAAAAAHHSDRADLRSVHTLTVVRVGSGEIATA